MEQSTLDNALQLDIVELPIKFDSILAVGIYLNEFRQQRTHSDIL